MTAKEIRSEVSPMVIWMADAAIREACIAINDTNPRLYTHPYNRITAEAEVLFRMFSVCAADVKEALVVVANGHDGLMTYPHHNYFDAFVDALQTHLSRYGSQVRLREPDWVLESL